jgi:hypothetical protein
MSALPPGMITGRTGQLVRIFPTPNGTFDIPSSTYFSLSWHGYMPMQDPDNFLDVTTMNLVKN